MSTRTGEETKIRAIVCKEGDVYIAQCLEYDICTQAADISALLDRLDLVVEAEFAACHLDGKNPCDTIGSAPNYYHGLWDKRSVNLQRVVNVPGPGVVKPARIIEVALAA